MREKERLLCPHRQTMPSLLPFFQKEKTPHLPQHQQQQQQKISAHSREHLFSSSILFFSPLSFISHSLSFAVWRSSSSVVACSSSSLADFSLTDFCKVASAKLYLRKRLLNGGRGNNSPPPTLPSSSSSSSSSSVHQRKLMIGLFKWC